jgi:hypothetical protein
LDGDRFISPINNDKSLKGLKVIQWGWMDERGNGTGTTHNSRQSVLLPKQEFY